MYRNLEGGSELNEKRSNARHTRTRQAGGVAGGVMLDARCSINVTLSAGSDPYPSLRGVCGSNERIEALAKETCELRNLS